MRKTFRHFIPPIEFGFTEMARGDVHVNQTMPIMPGVVSAMNVITYPSEADRQKARVAKARFLEWIHTEGLRQALVGRREIADLASQELGVEVPQEVVFAPQAVRQKIVGPNGTYDDIYPEMQALYDQKYEPKVATLARGKKPANVSLRAINKLLAGSGQQPFRFGSEGGLIEFLERGDWKKKGRNWAAAHGRHGFDLTLPPGQTGMKEDKRTGKWFYSFGSHPEYGGFEPPKSTFAWRKVFHTALAMSRANAGKKGTFDDNGVWTPTAEDALDPLNQGIASGQIDPRQVKHDNLGDYFKHTMGLDNYHASAEGIVFEDEQDFEKAKECTRAYFNKKYDQTPKLSGGGMTRIGNSHAYLQWRPDYLFDAGNSKEKDIQFIIDNMFDDEAKTMKTSFYRVYQNQEKIFGKSSKQAKDKVAAYNILAQGADLAGGIQFDKKSSIFNQAIKAIDIDELQSDSEEVSEKALFTGSFRPVGLSPQEMDYKEISPERDEVRLSLLGTNQILFATRSGKNKWAITKTPSDEHDPKSVTPDMTGKAGHAHGGDSPVPVSKHGSSWVRDFKAHDVDADPHQVDPDYASAKINAAGVKGSRPLPKADTVRMKTDWENHPERYGDEWVTSKQHGRQLASILGLAEKGGSNVTDPGAAGIALMQQMGNPAFKYGEPEDMGPYLASHGATPEEADQVVQGYEQAIADAIEPQPYDGPNAFMAPNKFRHDLYKLMLKNGFEWRANIAKSQARDAEKDDLGNYSYGLDHGRAEDGSGGIEVAAGSKSYGGGTAAGSRHIDRRVDADITAGRLSRDTAVAALPKMSTTAEEHKSWVMGKMMPAIRGETSKHHDYKVGYDDVSKQLATNDRSIASKVGIAKKAAEAIMATADEPNVDDLGGTNEKAKDDYHKALGCIDAGTDWAKDALRQANQGKLGDPEVAKQELQRIFWGTQIEKEICDKLGIGSRMASFLDTMGIKSASIPMPPPKPVQPQGQTGQAKPTQTSTTNAVAGTGTLGRPADPAMMNKLMRRKPPEQPKKDEVMRFRDYLKLRESGLI